jgi:hypothetical protein
MDTKKKLAEDWSKLMLNPITGWRTIDRTPRAQQKIYEQNRRNKKNDSI